MYPKVEFLIDKRLRLFGLVQIRDKDQDTSDILRMIVD